MNKEFAPSLPIEHKPHHLDEALVKAHAAMKVKSYNRKESAGHQLVLRIPISAIDDVQVREIAGKILSQLGDLPEGADVKLQRLYKNAQPESITLS